MKNEHRNEGGGWTAAMAADQGPSEAEYDGQGALIPAQYDKTKDRYELLMDAMYGIGCMVAKEGELLCHEDFAGALKQHGFGDLAHQFAAGGRDTYGGENDTTSRPSKELKQRYPLYSYVDHTIDAATAAFDRIYGRLSEIPSIQTTGPAHYRISEDEVTICESGEYCINGTVKFYEAGDVINLQTTEPGAENVGQREIWRWSNGDD